MPHIAVFAEDKWAIGFQEHAAHKGRRQIRGLHTGQEPTVVWGNLVTEFQDRNIADGLLRLPCLRFWNYTAQRNLKKKKLSALAGIKSFLSVRKTQKCSPCYHHWAFIKAPLHYYRTPPLSVEQKGKQWNGSTLHKHLSQTLKRQQRGEREIIHPHCFVSPSLFPQGQLPFSQNTAVKPSWKQFLQANVDTSCSNKVRHDIVLLSSYEKALEKEKGKQNE